MRAIQSLVALLVALPTTVEMRLHPRQEITDAAGLGILEGLQKSYTQPVSVTNLEPLLNRSATRQRILWGPYKLKPANVSHVVTSEAVKLDPNSDLFTINLGGLCDQCMVLSARVDLALKDGSTADLTHGVYSHHILMNDIGTSTAAWPISVLCDDSDPIVNMPEDGHEHTRTSMAQPAADTADTPFSLFLIQGEDSATINFASNSSQFESGFYRSRGNQMIMTAELVNYKNSENEVYFTLDYEYIPMKSKPAEFYNVIVGRFNMNGCENYMWQPPMDRAVAYHGSMFDIIEDGYFVDMKPHMHDGGVNMTIFVYNKAVCSSAAWYGQELDVNGQIWETITSYDPCPLPIEVKRGDTFSTDAWYDVTKHNLRPMSTDLDEHGEAMAVAIFVFANKELHVLRNE